MCKALRTGGSVHWENDGGWVGGYRAEAAPAAVACREGNIGSQLVRTIALEKVGMGCDGPG